MAFRLVPLTVEIRLNGNHGGDPRVTIVHYRRGAGTPTPTVADLQTIAADWLNRVFPSLLACVSDKTTYTDIQVTDIDNQGGLQYAGPLAQPVHGLRTGEVLPGDDNLCLTKKTDTHQRGANGRLFVPDIAEGDQDDGFITQALQSLLLVLAQKLLLRLVDAIGRAWAPVVASKTHAAFHTITGVTFDSNMDHLVTRMRGKRRHRRRHSITT